MYGINYQLTSSSGNVFKNRIDKYLRLVTLRIRAGYT